MHPQGLDNDEADPSSGSLGEVVNMLVGGQEITPEVGRMGWKKEAVADPQPGNLEGLGRERITRSVHGPALAGQD